MAAALPSHWLPDLRRPGAALLVGVVVALALAVPNAVAAQVGDTGELKETMATRTTSAPRIDGRLDEDAWKRGVFLNSFRQRDPIHGALASDRTEVAFLYDDHALYVGARMYSSDPARIPAARSRHDGFAHAEYLTISLDPFLDRRTAFNFTITAGNGRRDFLHTRDSDDFFARDYSWDPVWEAKAVRDSLGWTAEMRIPFSQLRFPKRDIHAWGLNVNRGMPQKNEDVYWIVVPRNAPGYVSHFGILNSLAAIPSSRRIEMLPYVAGNATLTGLPTPRNPFNDGSVLGARAGADLKVGLGPSFTLDATINPDFGQVEADPAEVNLSAFETRQNERRPFFTEGRSLLSGGNDGYFYSRRVGAPPSGGASGDFVDRPGSTRILGAAKLTGRSGPWQLGLFGAVTERTRAVTYDSLPATFGSTEVEPVAFWAAGRLQHLFASSGSTVAFALAGLRRGLAEGSPLEQLVSREALSGGADFALRFDGGAWGLSGRLGFSHVAGAPAAIQRIQEAPARYFQRPDADYVEVDPTRESLTGFTSSLRLSKNAGAWVGNVNLESDSPGFETNDTGRLQNGDDIGVSSELTLRQTSPSQLWRRARVTVSGRLGWNYGGILRDQQVKVGTGINLHNYWDVNLSLQYNPRTLNDNLTRGGPLMQTGWRTRTEFSASSNSSSSTTLRLTGNFESAEFGAWAVETGIRFTVAPTSTLSVSVDPGYQRRVVSRQYVGRFADGPAATFGTRYVFAKIERSQISMRFRASYLFAPSLSLEAYAEPFSASGRYYDFGELEAARSRHLRLYGDAPGTSLTRQGRTYQVTDQTTPGSFTFGNPDFNSLSFRSNLVLRWEWQPGSTLFLVWQQSRGTFCTASSVDRCPNGVVPGSLPSFASVTDPFDVPGNNFLAVKVSYWIPVR